MTSRAKTKYFEWLLSVIDSGNRVKQYLGMLDILFNTEFYWVIDFDYNRACDGLDLRDGYIPRDESPCSVLEMMVALAIRMEGILMEEGTSDNTSEWFWIMVDNLGLLNQTNEKLDAHEVDLKVHNFLERDYQYDGTGGLFRLCNPPDDLRTVEIWIQMNWFINEL